MKAVSSRAPRAGDRFISITAWVFALLLVALAIYLGWQRAKAQALSPGADSIGQSASENFLQNLLLSEAGEVSATPEYHPAKVENALSRNLSVRTIIPERPKTDVKKHTVDTGDSVFAIAQSFDLEPETVLWANYDQLNDNPDLLELGMELTIPPVDGVYYQWQDGDTVEKIANEFDVEPEAILAWSGNNFDLSNPVKEPGEYVMVPGGHREFQQWIIPVIPRGKAGVLTSVLGAGACPGGYDGAYGTGSFIWPASNHSVSGNDFWAGHLAIDIAAGTGAPIYAADSGVVVFAGGANGGYGNMVMIDHGNGYQTLYSHMSKVSTRCGASVSQGTIIGYAGSTGNSTGPHLHFEVRFMGGFINPWSVLP